MKRLLGIAALVATLTALPSSAASAAEVIRTQTCPPGYSGVILIVNGRELFVCQNIVP